MKRNSLIVVFAILSFGLTALGLIKNNANHLNTPKGNCSTPNFLVDDVLFMGEADKDYDFIYAVESRFLSRIKRNDLFNAESIIDIVPQKATHALDVYNEVRVALIQEDGEITEVGMGHKLNRKQKALLRSIDYSTDIHISADCGMMSETTGELSKYDLVYYMSVIPDKEAEYEGGVESIVSHVKAGSIELMASMKKNQLKPGRVIFTVNEGGRIVDVSLDSSCGHPELDKRMTELLSSLPGKWNPATNAEGTPVPQELVLFYGIKGC